MATATSAPTCARPCPPSPASALARRPRRVIRPPALKPKTTSSGCSRRPPNLLRSRRRRRRPPWRRHAALRQLPGLRRRLLDGGAAAFVCFALQRERCANVMGGLHVHPTCLSTSALLMAGNVAAPATDPCPGGAHMPPCRHPNSRTANRVRIRYPPTHTPPPMLPPQTTAARDPALDLLSAPVSFATGGASPLTVH